MNKSTFFTGQPIFTQLLKFVSKDVVMRVAQQHQADRYSKRFNTYEHLVTMLYSIFNNCNSLREVATGMLAPEQRLTHMGARYHPRRNTTSDANNRRHANVFEIYYNLYKRYAPAVLSMLLIEKLRCPEFITQGSSVVIFKNSYVI